MKREVSIDVGQKLNNDGMIMLSPYELYKKVSTKTCRKGTISDVKGPLVPIIKLFVHSTLDKKSTLHYS